MKEFLNAIVLFALTLQACTKHGTKALLPTVTTTAITDITDSTAIFGGKVTNDGNGRITATGIRYDTSASFNTAKMRNSAQAADSFSFTIDGLNAGVTYYAEAFATNNVGTTYGNVVAFTSGNPAANYTVTTYAGNGADQSVDGPALQASFKNPRAVVVDPAGVLYVSDGGGTPNSGRVRCITTAGSVTTLATVGEGGADILLDKTGNLYVMDLDLILYKIAATGIISTLADSVNLGWCGPMDMDKNGNIFITTTHYVYKVTPAGDVSVLPYATTPLYFEGIAVDTSGMIYVANADQIERWDTLGHMTLMANADQGLGGDIPALRLDHNGNLIVSDAANYKIDLITPQGAFSTIAGTGARGDMDGSGSTSTFTHVRGLAIDAANNIYAAEDSTNRIRKLTRTR